jgi:hypothetical protein
MNIEERIFLNHDHDSFVSLALEIFDLQIKTIPVYRAFVNALGRPSPKTLEEIPFLPVGLFKEQKIIAEGLNPEITFLSSGTTGMIRSMHPVADLNLYRASFERSYRQFIGNPEEQVILALLPNYLEQGNSSLVYMVNELMRQTGSELSGFLLDNATEVSNRYRSALMLGKKIVIFGVSYALLDLAEASTDLSKATIIETGGMKGRRKELTKEELHLRIIEGTGVTHVSSEYGMTELLSQGYSNKEGIFLCPSWMRVLIRDVNDPFTFLESGRTGAVNIIDLANLYSCSFIATQDLGRLEEGGFRVLGRTDLSDLRGCNLMVE